MSDSTTQKGESLEKEIFLKLKTLLKNEGLFLPGNRSEIYWKKAYYSPGRQSDIIFDIAIETFRPEATKYSILTLIEVKNYNNNISVDNIEEFESKSGGLITMKFNLITFSLQ